MAEGASSSWESVGTPPEPLHVTTEDVGGRAGLLMFVQITKPAPQQSVMKVRCKLCSHTMSATNERLAAHFSSTSGRSVAPCKQATPEAIALGIRVLEDLDARRESGKKHPRGDSAVKSRSKGPRRARCTTIPGSAFRCGPLARLGCCFSLDKTFARFLIATAQSFGVGESLQSENFLLLLAAAHACPQWEPSRNRRTNCTTDLMRSCGVVVCSEIWNRK